MKKGFVFIETIIVVCILTVSLISLYANYSKIISNTKELNTFDTAEYNYKTYDLKLAYLNGKITLTENTCTNYEASLSENGIVKICLLKSVSSTNYVKTHNSKFDAYIIDYLNNNDFTEDNDNLFLVEYKKKDKQSSGDYLTYISSLNY